MKNLFYPGIFVLSLPACNNRNPNHESSGIPTESGTEINDKTIKDNRTYHERNASAEEGKNPGDEKGLKNDSIGNVSGGVKNR